MDAEIATEPLYVWRIERVGEYGLPAGEVARFTEAYVIGHRQVPEVDGIDEFHLALTPFPREPRLLVHVVRCWVRRYGRMITPPQMGEVRTIAIIEGVRKLLKRDVTVVVKHGTQLVIGDKTYSIIRAGNGGNGIPEPMGHENMVHAGALSSVGHSKDQFREDVIERLVNIFQDRDVAYLERVYASLEMRVKKYRGQPQALENAVSEISTAILLNDGDDAALQDDGEVQLVTTAAPSGAHYDRGEMAHSGAATSGAATSGAMDVENADFAKQWAKQSAHKAKEEKKRRFENDFETLKAVFPDCEEQHLLKLLRNFTGDENNRVDAISESLLEDKTYPRKPKATPKAVLSKSKEQLFREREVQFSKCTERINDVLYNAECIRVLYHVFNRVPTAIIRSHLEKHKGHYYGTFKSIMEVLKTAAHDRNVLQVDLMLSSGSVDFSRVNPTKVPFKLLKSKRIVSGCDVSCNLLKEEVAHVHELLDKQRVDRDEEVARKLNEEAYAEAGQLMECPCCYEEVPFEDLGTCEDGHVSCRDCIKGTVKGAMDSGKLEFNCSHEDCSYQFPESELRRILDEKQYEYYQKVKIQDDLRQADIEGLEQCPHCDFRGIMDDPANKIFACQNPACLRETCRLCKQDSHVPYRCEEVAKEKVEKRIRDFAAEEMTSALVRNCPNPKCAVPFFKEEGCNKMTCPKCKSVLCYLCRKNITKEGYNHFAGQNDGSGKCPLYSDNKKVNHEAVVTAARAAKRKLVETEGHLEHADIGVVDKLLNAGHTAKRRKKK